MVFVVVAAVRVAGEREGPDGEGGGDGCWGKHGVGLLTARECLSLSSSLSPSPCPRLFTLPRHILQPNSNRKKVVYLCKEHLGQRRRQCLLHVCHWSLAGWAARGRQTAPAPDADGLRFHLLTKHWLTAENTFYIHWPTARGLSFICQTSWQTARGSSYTTHPAPAPYIWGLICISWYVHILNLLGTLVLALLMLHLLSSPGFNLNM